MPKNSPKGPEKGRYKSVRGAGYADGGGHGEEKLVSYRNFSDPDSRMTTIGVPLREEGSESFEIQICCCLTIVSSADQGE